MFYQIFSIITVMAVLYIFWRARPAVFEPLPSDFFILFFLITWSPICLFPIEETHIGGYFLPASTQVKFFAAYNLMLWGLALGYYFSGRFWRSQHPLRIKRAPLSFTKQRHQFLLMTAVAIILVAIYLSSSGVRASLDDNMAYVKGDGLLSYTQLRRESGYEGAVMLYIHSRLQYSLVFLVFVGLIYYAVVAPRRFGIGVCLALVLFIVCASTMKKMPYIYYFLAAIATVVLALWARGKLSTRSLVIVGVVASVLVFVLILFLYSVQYRDYGQVGRERIIAITQFRIFSAYPAACKLYIDLFPETYSFTYGRTSSLLAPIIGHYGIQPYVLVPAHFGYPGTTFPGGYMAYAYADYGFLGVIAYSMAVGTMVQYLNQFCIRVRSMDVWVIAIIAVGFSTLWFWSKPITTAMLTGGLGLIPLLIMVFQRVTRGNQIHMPVSKR